MTEENDLIMDSGNLVEDGYDEDISDITATKSEDKEVMDFHIQMRGYTMHDFEAMVVEVAAKQLLQNTSEGSLAKKIEGRVVELTNQKINDALMPISKEIMEMPMIPEKFGKSKEPITIAEYVGLIGRDFLTTKVNREGKRAGTYDHGEPRINWLIAEVLDKRFEKEVSAATANLKKEMKEAASEALSKLINDERQHIMETLGWELKQKR